MFPAVAQFDLHTDSIPGKGHRTQSDSVTRQFIKTTIDLGESIKYNNPDSSIYYFNQALTMAREIGDQENVARSYSRIGGTRYVMGEYDFALEAFMKSLKIFEVMDHKRGIAVGLNNIGMIQNMQKDYESSLKNHQRSLKIARSLNDSLMEVINMFNMAITYQAMNLLDSSITVGHRAIQKSKAYGLDAYLFRIINQIGESYVLKKEYGLAITYFSMITDAKDYHNKWEISFAHSGLALAYKKMGKVRQSIWHGHKALNMALELNAKWDIQRATKILADSYAQQKQWDSAYTYLLEHKAYSDSIFNETKNNQINYLRLKRQEAQNKKLEQENRLKEELLAHKELMVTIYIIIIVATILMALLLFRNNYLKNKLNRKLSDKNQQLTQLIHTKDTLFRVIAHDLKSPVSTIVSYTEILADEEEEFDSESSKEVMRKFNQIATRSLTLVENLLDWARTQTEEISVNRETIELFDMANQILLLYKQNLLSKHISVHNTIPENLTVLADQHMLSAIYRNFITNAIKFTPDGGTIHLTAKKTDDGVEIDVIDSGIGITQEDLTNILDPNQIISHVGTQQEKGTGLGLSICKSFIEKQGGTLHIESIPNEGTTCRFILPD